LPGVALAASPGVAAAVTLARRARR
jgi:hypothetical protein